MGAIKNIFDNIGNVFKSAKAEVKAIKPAVKSLDSSVVKTSSKTLGSTAKVISGGQSTLKASASSFAKGVGSTANVGGKAFGVTGILGGVSLAGAAVYDYVGDKWAVTTVQREYENQIKLAGQEADVTKKAQDNQLDYMKKVIELNNAGQNSSSLGAGGAAGLNDSLFPMGAAAGETATADASASKTMWLALLGIVAVGAGTYIYTKRGHK